MNPLRFFIRCRSGAAAAEMVLVLPLLVVLLYGSSELGYYFYSEHQVVKGVRDGARYASRQSFADINCTDSIPASVETAIQEITRTGRLSGGTARVPGWVNADVSVTVTCPATAITTGIYVNEVNAPQINVTASVSYDSLFEGLGVIDSSYSLNASHQAAVMGI